MLPDKLDTCNCMAADMELLDDIVAKLDILLEKEQGKIPEETELVNLFKILKERNYGY
jgi:hypothetical protein